MERFWQIKSKKNDPNFSVWLNLIMQLKRKIK